MTRREFGPAAKTQCPLCDAGLEKNDTHEYSVKTIVRMVSYLREHSAELRTTQQRLYFKSLACLRDGEVPPPVRAIFPTMSLKRYAEKLADPLFLYEYVRVCSPCYEFVQEALRDEDTLSV